MEFNWQFPFELDPNKKLSEAANKYTNRIFKITIETRIRKILLILKHI